MCVHLTWECDSDLENETDTYMFDYHIVGEITVNNHRVNYYMDGEGQKHESEYDEEYILTLNEQGNVVNSNRTGEYDMEDTKIGYTADGRLEKLWAEAGKEGEESWYDKFYYTDGLLTKVEFFERGESEVEELPVDRLYPNRYPANGTNIDFNAFIYEIGSDDMEEILCQIGLLGKGSDCLMEVGGYSEDDEWEEPMPNYSEPNKVYKRTEKVAKWPEVETPLPIKYEFDGDKFVTKFSYEDPYELWEYYYEIHVESELNDPEWPESGYKYEIKNEKWKKLSDEKDTYTYTVVYE